MLKRAVIFGCVAGLVACALALGGCDSAPRRGRTLSASSGDSEAYLTSVADTLNDLADNVDLNLLPAQPIVTAQTSSDGKAVRAVCIANPEVPETPVYNYLKCVDGNGKFYSLDVRPNDIVRYYVNFDEESAELGIAKSKYLEVHVRRLDSADPENALIIDGQGLSAPVMEPATIEIWRFSDKRTDAIRSALDRYEKLRRPVRGWEPSPDLGALQQVVERANQWLRSQNSPAGAKWKASALIAGLPVALRDAPGVAELVTRESLETGQFADWEGRLLEQAILCRDVSQWARGKRGMAGDVDVAAALFDWTVRNVQLDGPDAPPIVGHPWQALMYGHGPAALRAWVFVELCRQQGIDAVIVQPPAQAGGSATGSERSEDASGGPMLVGALVDNQLHLFDPQMGLPLPGEDGKVATLPQLRAKPELLDAWKLDGEPDYWVNPGVISELTASIVASPTQLAKRSRAIEDALEGEQYVVLSIDADAVKAKLEKLGSDVGVKSVGLWRLPFQTLADEETIKISQRRLAVSQFAPFGDRPLLWQARLLHFQGEKEVRAEERNDPLAEPRRGHADALRLYQDPTVRPGDAILKTLAANKQVVYGASKANASYWLGLLSYDRGNYEVANDWFDGRTLKVNPDGPWASGARYNLARSLEKLDRAKDAIELLKQTPKDDPARRGNLLLAKRLAAKSP